MNRCRKYSSIAGSKHTCVPLVLILIDGTGLARTMQSSYCRGQLNTVIFQISEALEVFSIVQACEKTQMLADDLQSNQIKFAVDQCLRIAECMEKSIDTFSGAVSNLVVENKIGKTKLLCMIDEARNTESELKMNESLLRLVSSCQKPVLDDPLARQNCRDFHTDEMS